MTIEEGPSLLTPNAPQARPSVLRINPFIPGEAPAEPSVPTIKLSANESPLGASPAARAAYEAVGEQLQRYPDGPAHALRRAIAGKFTLKSDQLICGAGSEELLHLAARAFAEPGDEAVISQYSFAVHRIAALAAGAEPIVVPERECCVDLAGMIAAVTPRTRVVFWANPGNPTGTLAVGGSLREFHAALPPTVLLVLDAAYAEFAEGVGQYESGLALVAEGARNVLVTRTFSKMYGLAGLRIGWGYATAEIVDALSRVRPAFNASSAAQAAAIASLHDDDFVRRARELNDRGLRQLCQGLASVGIATTDSVCNFVLAHLPRGLSGVSAFQALRGKGVLVRPVVDYDLPNALRITVGLPEENAVVIDALRAFLAET